MAKKKAKKTLLTIILAGVATLCIILSLVSVFFSAIKVKDNDASVEISSTRFLIGSFKTQEDLSKDMLEAISSGDEDKIEAVTKNAMVYSLLDSNEEDWSIGSTLVVFATCGTLLFGLIAVILTILSIFGRARIAAVVFALLTAIMGLVSTIGAGMISGAAISMDLVAIGAGPILILVFGLIAAGLGIAGKVLVKKAKA